MPGEAWLYPPDGYMFCMASMHMPGEACAWLYPHDGYTIAWHVVVHVLHVPTVWWLAGGGMGMVEPS